MISQNSPKFYDFLDAVALENRGPRNKYPADARRQLFIYSVNNMQGLGGICYGDVFLSSVYFALPASVVPFKEISATIAHEVSLSAHYSRFLRSQQRDQTRSHVLMLTDVFCALGWPLVVSYAAA